MSDMATQTTTQPKGAAHLTSADFESAVKAAGTPVFVDFYATWCGPCKLAAPVIDKLADEYRGKVLIVKVDTDENIDLARQYGVQSIPTVVILKANGEKLEVVDKTIGFPGEQKYRDMLSQVAPAEMAKAA
jgi:thioredoxin 1